jgi:hypothetical protein
MGQAITSRELFKSHGTSGELPVGHIYKDKKYTETLPYKNWFDSFLLDNPSFIGRAKITSPQGLEVEVNYGKTFVEYLYGIEFIDKKPVTGRLIMSRSDAVLFNVPAKVDGLGLPVNSNPDFADIPWDRPLADNEILTKKGPIAFWMIFTDTELDTPEATQNELLERLEVKIDRILTLLN